MSKTAEQVVAEAFTRVREPEYHISEEEDFSDARIAVAALREAGMLVETEWEYGVDMGWGQNPPLINVSETERDARIRATNHPRRKLVRRRVYVGEWEEVPND